MFVVFVDCFCCSSWLAFLIMADLINVMRHFCSTELFAFEAIFCSQTFFLKNIWIFGVFYLFLFGRHLCQKCGWAGSELDVRTHITEPPCLICVQLFRPSYNEGRNMSACFFALSFWTQIFITGRHQSKTISWKAKYLKYLGGQKMCSMGFSNFVLDKNDGLKSSRCRVS